MGRRKKASKKDLHKVSDFPNSDEIRAQTATSAKEHDEDQDAETKPSSNKLKISISILNSPIRPVVREEKVVEENELKSPKATKRSDVEDGNKHKVDAFKFLMDSRMKSIGQNAEGKCELQMHVETVVVEEEENNGAIKQRKKESFLAWANEKVTLKRKLQELKEEAKNERIGETLIRRSERMKTMLRIQTNDDDDEDEFEVEKRAKKRRRKETRKSERITNVNTSKKPKNVLIELNENADEDVMVLSEDNDKKTRKKNKHSHKVLGSNKPGKLAPIFAKARKEKLDAATIEARKSFLHSDLPDILKKKALRKENDFSSTETFNEQYFPTISHVQQKDDSEFWALTSTKLFSNETYNTNDTNPVIIKSCELKLGSVTEQRIFIKEHQQETETINRFDKETISGIIKRIKAQNPGYPVYRAFKTLCNMSGLDFEENAKSSKAKKKRKSLPKFGDLGAMWTEKYKPSSSTGFAGNHARVLDLRKWLSRWLENSKRTSSSESEFDSESEERFMNGIILFGPPGTGKTIGVYAVAKELGFNVLELNPSSKRTGKLLLQELQEATQSHQVHPQNSKKTLLSYTNGEIDHQHQHRKSGKKLCLLLVDDVDVVFEQDDGFIVALTQLLQSSKRPIVLTTSDLKCAHLQKFSNQYPVLRFKPLSTKNHAVWLQILCAIEGLVVDINSLSELLKSNKGDARKTVLNLQFWAKSGGNLCAINDNDFNKNASRNSEVFDDIDPPVSSVNSNIFNAKTHGDCLKTFTNLTDILPRPLSLDNFSCNARSLLKKNEPEEGSFCDLKNYAKLLNNLCVSSCIYSKFNVTNDFNINKNYGVLKDSLVLKDNEDAYETNHEIAQELTHDLLRNSYKLCAEAEDGELLWTKNHASEGSGIRSKLFEGILKSFPHSLTMDYETLAFDYYSAIRNIAKIEDVKLKENAKRTNRFYSHLNRVGINCKEVMITELSNSLKMQDSIS